MIQPSLNSNLSKSARDAPEKSYARAQLDRQAKLVARPVPQISALVSSELVTDLLTRSPGWLWTPPKNSRRENVS